MKPSFFKRFVPLLILLVSGQLMAQNYPEKPNPPRLVNDYAGMLSTEEAGQLEAKLVSYYDSTSNQIAVVIVNDLEGYEPSDYAFGLGEKWGIGIKGRDNGILILVKPRTNESKGQVFIATGYGAEGAVPDAAAKLIVENEIIPRFKNGEYYGGLDAAVTVIFQLMRGEYSWADYQGKKPGAGAPVGGAIGAGLVILFVFIVFVVMGIRQSKRAHTLSGSTIPWWIWAGMMSASGSRRSGSNWGNFSSGGGIFKGGGGGGGFGGFGGGSFGGGGAGGSW